MRVPILAYHALHAPGSDYASNDHIALAADLALLDDMAVVIAPLRHIAEHLAGTVHHDYLERERCVGLSWDDGTNHDFIDFYHPAIGLLESMATIFAHSRIFRRQSADALLPKPIATSFVIVSPTARAALDRACIAGRQQWGDYWWPIAARSGYIEVANHSWDHLHPALDAVMHSANVRGDFHSVSSFDDADAQILSAQRFLATRLGEHTSPLFAYPYGHANTFLRTEYFPARESNFLAAFSTGGKCVDNLTNRWNVPRFVCGEHWNESKNLRALLIGS